MTQETEATEAVVGGIVKTVAPPQREYALDTREGEISIQERKTPTPVEFRMFHSKGDAAAGQSLAAGVNFGDVITDAQVILIFWGNEWTQPNPPVSSDAVIAAVKSICGGAYVHGLQEYGMQKATLVQTVFAPSASAFTNFQDKAVQGLVTSLLNAKTVPIPNSGNHFDYLYCVVMPSTATFGPGGVNGYHSTYSWTNPATNKKLQPRYAMLLNNGTLDYLSTVFSHELAEAVTDPDGKGIQIAPGSPTNWNEVSDICTSVTYLNGVAVQSFWSQMRQACVVPHYRNNDPRQVPPAGVALQVVAIRKAFSLEKKQHFISEVRTQDASGNVYELFRGDVAVLIDQGKNTFFVKGADGSQASVEVRTEHNSTFIATHPDDTTADNLLSLPAF